LFIRKTYLRLGPDLFCKVWLRSICFRPLDDFSSGVIVDLTGNGAYPTPPVAVAQLTTLKDALEQAIAKQAQGGTTATAAKSSKAFRNACDRVPRK
jgi:hypothetical protein